MGTGMQEKPQGHDERHPRWERFARAARLGQYGALQTQGLSQRQAAQGLDVPRSPLPAWRASHEHLDEPPGVVACLHSVAGLACVHRLGVALHLVSTAVGAWGMLLVCLGLRLTSLDRCVGASYGTQHQDNRRVAEAIMAYRQAEHARLAHAMPPQAITMPQAETFTGGRCLVGMEPVSHSSLLEQTAQARAHATWQELMEQALVGLPCQVMQATSDEAPGLLADVAHPLGAHHAPALFHVQHALRKAVAAP